MCIRPNSQKQTKIFSEFFLIVLKIINVCGRIILEKIAILKIRYNRVKLVTLLLVLMCLTTLSALSSTANVI